MKKLWKIIKYLFVVATAVIAADILVVVGFSVYYPAITKKADAVLILGAAINTPALYNRSLEGLRLYQQGKAGVLVLSGGRISDKYISEAQYMQQVIIQNSNGQPPPMILEQDSHNTYENIKNSKKKIPNAKSVILVSDGYHLARAAAVAKREGFKDVYWSSPRPFYYQPHELAYYYIREVVAMVSYIPKFIAN